MATVHIYRTEGDRLAEHWGIRDELSARIQLGLVSAPASAAAPVAERPPGHYHLTSGRWGSR